MCLLFRDDIGYDDSNDGGDGMCSKCRPIAYLSQVKYKKYLPGLSFYVSGFSVIFSADLSNTKCEAAENQASFAQPVIVQPEIDIEVSEVWFVITISKCGWDSRRKNIQRFVNIL